MTGERRGLADPRVQEILQALGAALAAVRQCPLTSRGRREVEGLLGQAAALAGVTIGDEPNIDALRRGFALARQAMLRQLRLADELQRLPIETVHRLWRLADMPEAAIREMGRTLRESAQNALNVIDRNAPLLASTYGQVVTGLGGGAIIALALVAFFLLKK